MNTLMYAIWDGPDDHVDMGECCLWFITGEATRRVPSSMKAQEAQIGHGHHDHQHAILPL